MTTDQQAELIAALKLPGGVERLIARRFADEVRARYVAEVAAEEREILFGIAGGSTPMGILHNVGTNRR